MIQYTPWRPYNNFRTATQFFCLATNRFSAIDSQYACFSPIRKFRDFPSNLNGQLSGGDKNQGLRTTPLVAFDTLEYRYGKRSRFSGTRSSLAKQIAAFEGLRNQTCLHGSRLGVFHMCKGIEHGL